MDPFSTDSLCPCQSGSTYEQCCQPTHQRQPIEPTPNAEALMRARYTAYALGLIEFLMDTTHRENPEYRKNTKAWRQELIQYCQATEFLGLAVLHSALGDTVATVLFEAKLKQGGCETILRENSRFVKLGNRWLYHSKTPETL